MCMCVCVCVHTHTHSGVVYWIYVAQDSNQLHGNEPSGSVKVRNFLRNIKVVRKDSTLWS
jgi:hypothetical protein